MILCIDFDIMYPSSLELHLLLVGHEASVSIEPVISPIILNMWVSHVSDPFISIDAIEVLEVIMLGLFGHLLKFSTCIRKRTSVMLNCNE